jgi:hypothetical protein
MKFKFVAFVAVVALLAGCAKIVVVHVPNAKGIAPGAKNAGDDMNPGAANKPELGGLFYALPKTVVRVGVKVNHSVSTPAPYMKFAAIFAPEGQPVCEASTCEKEGGEKGIYELQQGVSFATFGEPDPDHVYMVKFMEPRASAFDQTISMTWNEAGLISTASASVTNRTVDVALAAIKMAASLGTKATFGAPTVTPAAKKEEVCLNPSENDSWIIQLLEKYSFGGLVGNYCAMKKVDRDKFIKGDAPMLEQGVKAYEDVNKLAIARINLLTGSSQSMAPAEMLNRLDALIGQRLATLYLGSKKTDTWEGSLNIRKFDSREAVGKQIPILYIDPMDGVCIIEAEVAPDSKPIPEKFNILGADRCQRASAVYMIISYYPEIDTQLFQRVEQSTTKPSAKELSFRYRIPAQVKAELKDNNKSYGTGTFNVAQLGTVVSLPSNHFSKTLSYDLSFIEATGGLKSFKLGTTGALDSASMDTLSTAGGTVLDARNAARKADETSKDEVTTLTRQNTILKLKSDNCEILQKNGYTCTIQP